MSTTSAELIGRIKRMPEDSPERWRYGQAKAMFGFLVRRGAWMGCRDWDGLAPEVQAAFMDMAAMFGASQPARVPGTDDSESED